MREAFERMYRNDPVKLARGKYLRQDYDRRETQANWEVFQAAWPIIFAAGMERAAEICDAKSKQWDTAVNETAGYAAELCAGAIRAEIKGNG